MCTKMHEHAVVHYFDIMCTTNILTNCSVDPLYKKIKTFGPHYMIMVQIFFVPIHRHTRVGSIC